jgi:Beta-lactamase enzyme family
VRAVAVLLTALALAPAATADDFALLRAKESHLGPAQRSFANDPDGYQARYDAGRDLMEATLAAGPAGDRCTLLRNQLLAFAWAQIRTAEAADRPVRRMPPALPRVTAACLPSSRAKHRPRRTAVRLGLPPGTQVAAPPRTTDTALARRLAAIGTAFDGWAGLWVHDLRSGRSAGWNSEARFPGASTVKLGAMTAALRVTARPEHGRHWHDLQQIGAWSSNLGANRILRELGQGAVDDGLRRLGMWSSTYPGPYRATTARLDAPKPPPLGTTRVTTAQDLGRALYRLHSAALGNRRTLRETGLTQHQARLGLSLLLRPAREGDNVGLLRPWLGNTLVAEKNGWLSDARTTAAIVYRHGAPVIVVVEAYRPGISRTASRLLGRDVLRALDAR